MDLQDWQRLHDRLDSAHRACTGTRIGVREFWTMHRAIHQLLQQANAEWVNCRRRGVGSARFDALLISAEQSLKNFEGYILLAKLMHKENQ
jgi:hypothetical protein